MTDVKKIIENFNLKDCNLFQLHDGNYCLYKGGFFYINKNTDYRFIDQYYKTYYDIDSIYGCYKEVIKKGFILNTYTKVWEDYLTYEERKEIFDGLIKKFYEMKELEKLQFDSILNKMNISKDDFLLLKKEINK